MKKLFEIRRRLRRYLNPAAPNVQYGCTIVESSLEDFVYVGPECRIFNAQVEAFVSIGPRVIIGEAEHDIGNIFLSNALLQTDQLQAYRDASLETTVLERDCWLGAGVFVKKGVRIGRGAVVAAGAVVVHDVAPFCVVGGVPAKIIGSRLAVADEKYERWWEAPPSELRYKVLSKPD